MKKDYINQISKILPISENGFKKFQNYIVVREIPSGTILLSEGEIATKLFLVINGCLRAYFVKENGIEISSQFFIESQIVASFESAMTGTPSRLNIDAIEDSTIASIQMKNLKKVIGESSSGRDHFNKFLMSRLIYYMNKHASFILDNPEKRYIKLIQENPELVSRLPQQYIASYLGITPVSLSRIRTRLKKQINNC
jgi:CRP-like cAMP-binding protein